MCLCCIYLTCKDVGLIMQWCVAFVSPCLLSLHLRVQEERDKNSLDVVVKFKNQVFFLMAIFFSATGQKQVRTEGK